MFVEGDEVVIFTDDQVLELFFFYSFSLYISMASLSLRFETYELCYLTSRHLKPV